MGKYSGILGKYSSFLANTVVFWANAVVFWVNTGVFWANTGVIWVKQRQKSQKLSGEQIFARKNFPDNKKEHELKSCDKTVRKQKIATKVQN